MKALDCIDKKKESVGCRRADGSIFKSYAGMGNMMGDQDRNIHLYFFAHCGCVQFENESRKCSKQNCYSDNAWA